MKIFHYVNNNWISFLYDVNMQISEFRKITSSCQVLVPHCSDSITQLLVNFQFRYSSHKFFYTLITLHQTQVAGVANVKALVPRILYLFAIPFNLSDWFNNTMAIMEGR
jgi:hypothetical protein